MDEDKNLSHDHDHMFAHKKKNLKIKNYVPKCVYIYMQKKYGQLN